MPPALKLTAEQAGRVIDLLHDAWSAHINEHNPVTKLAENQDEIQLPNKIRYWQSSRATEMTPEKCAKRNKCLAEFFQKNRDWAARHLEATVLMSVRRAVVKADTYEILESCKEKAAKEKARIKAAKEEIDARILKANPDKGAKIEHADKIKAVKTKEKRLMRLWVD